MPIAMARHILVKTEAEAAELKKRLAAGEPFRTFLGKKALYLPHPEKKALARDSGEVNRGQMRSEP